MKKTIVSVLCLAALGLASPAMALDRTVVVEFTGPGGHSSGAYTATSALHAAGRALMLMVNEAAYQLPTGSFKVTSLKGGNSVNSIASDGTYNVILTAATQADLDAYAAKVEATVNAGAKAENDFRGVTAGQIVNGARRDIRYRIDNGEWKNAQ
jgi:metal-dependent amidase/aminoacylase/carboxypeptidase family protein